MNFELSSEQELVFRTAFEFGQQEIAPNASLWEREGTIPRSVLRRAGELGLGALCVPEAQGGDGLSRLDATLVFEALAEACPSVAAFVSIHNMCAAMIARYGAPELLERWLGPVLSMEAVVSYCLTEASCGSDAAALRTRALREAGGYRIAGEKSFISGGGYSDLYVVMCRTGEPGPRGISALVVPDGAKGLSFGAPERKMGWRAQPTAQVRFDDCRAPVFHLLGQEGRGFAYAMEALDGGRLNIAACALGGAQGALKTALGHAAERAAFGKKLTEFQSVQFKLADMETDLQAARALLRQAAWKLDQDAPDARKQCAMAKRFVTDAAFRVANEALQILGGYGYLEDSGVEKIVRDLRVHQILEGTNEIMRVITARALLAERGAA